MSKRQTSKVKRELKELGEAVESGGVGEQAPWPEQKRRASVRARKGHFDVERILFRVTLEDDVAYFAKAVARDRRLSPELQQSSPKTTFLALVAERLADRLALRFRDGDDMSITPDAVELALSFLYLFPKLWKALDKPLTIDEIDVLDFEKLLSERRKVRA